MFGKTSQLVLLCATLLSAQPVLQQSIPPIPAPAPEVRGDARSAPDIQPVPVVPPVGQAAPTGEDWAGLARQSLAFLGLEHGFRLLTEAGTRSEAFGLGAGYRRGVGSLHGWADGDPFMVNYIGHPMQGSVAGFIWTQNDPSSRNLEIGKDRRYWKSRLRATAFAWVYSEQFEIGPLSEASIGHVQAYYPQQGFVDHVVTPTAGLGWMIAEDTLDKYLVRPMEARYRNPVARALVRGFFNPTRSMANMMAGNYPWHRDDRPGITTPTGRFQALEELRRQQHSESQPPGTAGIAPFELTVHSQATQFNSRPCVGGGAEAAMRVSPKWQIVLEVSGCKLLDMPQNLSGDSLAYRIGPRWTPAPAGRWVPYAHVLVGGNKLTTEEFFPQLKAAVEPPGPPPATPNYALHALYTSSAETNGLSLAAGSGVDLKLNRALALRVANLEYTHSWVGGLNGLEFQNGLQFSTGLVLRMGTW
jgi:hypothetical protein